MTARRRRCGRAGLPRRHLPAWTVAELSASYHGAEGRVLSVVGCTFACFVAAMCGIIFGSEVAFCVSMGLGWAVLVVGGCYCAWSAWTVSREIARRWEGLPESVRTSARAICGVAPDEAVACYALTCMESHRGDANKCRLCRARRAVEAARALNLTPSIRVHHARTNR